MPTTFEILEEKLKEAKNGYEGFNADLWEALIEWVKESVETKTKEETQE